MIDIRSASFSDIGALLPLIQDYWALESIVPFEAEVVAGQLEALLADPRLGHLWVGSERDELVGYVITVDVFSLEHGGLTAEIDELFVQQMHRRQGVASRLLDAAEAAAHQRGCTNISLRLGVSNDAAAAFYHARRYRPVSKYTILERRLPDI